jgi:predicted site-specific integrase-resolvase
MSKYSTRQAAQKLGISMTSLTRYIADGKLPAPKATLIGRYEVRAWSDEDIERVRALLPKIANGRKTRWQKERNKQKRTAGKPKH